MGQALSRQKVTEKSYFVSKNSRNVQSLTLNFKHIKTELVTIERKGGEREKVVLVFSPSLFQFARYLKKDEANLDFYGGVYVMYTRRYM